MFPKTTGPFTLQRNGSTLEVDTETGWISNTATLRIDGEVADRQREDLEPIVLKGADVEVTVRWSLTRQVAGCTARPPRTGDATDAEVAEVEFAPPEGSHAWKLAKLKRERPGLYASRHVAIAVLQTVIGLLGIGALVFGIVRGILQDVDLPDLPIPDIDIPIPDWLRYIVSWEWLVDLVRASPLDFLFDLSWPDWGDDGLRTARWVVPILIAIAIAIAEYARRTRRGPDNAEERSHNEESAAEEPVPAAPRESEPSDKGTAPTDDEPNEPPQGDNGRPQTPQERRFVALPPISTIHLFGPERNALIELLTSLDGGDDWFRPTVCEGWNVHDVALHLLGGDVGLLSGGRDGFRGSPAVPTPPDLSDWDTLVGWIDTRNAAWVDATRRMSPTLLCELLTVTGQRLVAWLPEVDMDAPGIPVNWAGSDPAPTWLHIAREYTERWIHQQHIRDAVARPGLTEPDWLHPVLDTFARALPHTLRDHQRPDGTTVELRITGPAGGSWRVRRDTGTWSFTGADAPASTVVTLDEETAWRGFTRGIDIERIRSRAQVVGDPEIGDAILHMVTIIA